MCRERGSVEKLTQPLGSDLEERGSWGALPSGAGVVDCGPRANPAQRVSGSAPVPWLAAPPAHAHALYGSFCATAAEFGGCHGDHLTCPTENSYFLSLYRKCLPTLALKGHEGNDDLRNVGFC